MNNDTWINVFQQEKLNEQLKHDGIAKFDLPGFDAGNCDEFLKDTVQGYPHAFADRFYGSISLKREINQQVDRGLSDRVRPHIARLLTNHKLLNYFFLIKGIGDKSRLHLHQDWSIVDERNHRSYNLWIPLSDSTVENGTLFVWPGSHHLPLNVRGGGIPPKYIEHFDQAKKYMKPIVVRAGQGLIFNCRLLHYSPNNTTSQSRTAIINSLIPNDAKTTSFHGGHENGALVVSEYSVPEDMYLQYDEFDKQKDEPNPMGIFKGKISYANADFISKKDFAKLIKLLPKKKKWIFF
jgi:hypothetical protein